MWFSPFLVLVWPWKFNISVALQGIKTHIYKVRTLFLRNTQHQWLNPLQGSNVFAVKMSVAAKATVKSPSATDLLATIVPFSVRVGILVASAGSDEEVRPTQMALCIATARNWCGIPSCGFAASRKAIYLFVRRRIRGDDCCSSNRREGITRVYVGVPACFARHLDCRLQISGTSSQPAAHRSSAECKR